MLGQGIVRRELKFTLNMVYEKNTESIQLNHWQENDFSGFGWRAAHPLESQLAPFSLMENTANGTYEVNQETPATIGRWTQARTFGIAEGDMQEKSTVRPAIEIWGASKSAAHRYCEASKFVRN